MSKSIHGELSRRESQVMNIIFAREEATAEDVRAQMPDAPSNATVRTILRTLEKKGHLQHHTKGRTYVYRPTTPPEEARRSILRHVVETFFSGSMPDAVATLLSERDPSKEEIERLSRIIERAREEGR